MSSSFGICERICAGRQLVMLILLPFLKIGIIKLFFFCNFQFFTNFLEVLSCGQFLSKKHCYIMYELFCSLLFKFVFLQAYQGEYKCKHTHNFVSVRILNTNLILTKFNNVYCAYRRIILFQIKNGRTFKICHMVQEDNDMMRMQMWKLEVNQLIELMPMCCMLLNVLQKREGNTRHHYIRPIKLDHSNNVSCDIL